MIIKIIKQTFQYNLTAYYWSYHLFNNDIKGIVEFCFQTANAFKVHGYCSYSYL